MTECRFKSVLEAYPPKRENLVSVLQDIQEKDGFISPEAVKSVPNIFRFQRPTFIRSQVFTPNLNSKSPASTL